MSKIFQVMNQLKKAGIYFEVKNFRDDYLMFYISVPGQRWEVEILSNGSVEVEIFKSDGEIYDDKILEELFNKHSDLKS